MGYLVFLLAQKVSRKFALRSLEKLYRKWMHEQDELQWMLSTGSDLFVTGCETEN